MNVVSLKSNKKLLKGVTYEAESFDNTPPSPGQRWHRASIYIKNFGWYLCKNFSDTNGKPLPTIKYTSPNASQRRVETVDARSLKKNDIIVCKSDKYKYLVRGGKYRISEVKDANTWRAQIKLEGYSRWLSFSSWAFRILSLQESRELALSSIFNQPENFSVEFVRKFDKEKNQTKVLVESIAKSILDPYRHHYDILGWTIEKSKYQGLKKEDFDQIMNMPFGELLKMCDNLND
jgi:hypothetical protein